MGPAAPKVGDTIFMGTGVYAGASPTTIVRSWARCVAEVCTDVGSSPSYVIGERRRVRDEPGRFESDTAL